MSVLYYHFFIWVFLMFLFLDSNPKYPDENGSCHLHFFRSHLFLHQLLQSYFYGRCGQKRIHNSSKSGNFGAPPDKLAIKEQIAVLSPWILMNRCRNVSKHCWCVRMQRVENKILWWGRVVFVPEPDIIYVYAFNACWWFGSLLTELSLCSLC